MKTQHKAYLLRLRREAGQSHWRAIVEDAHTGERLHFANQTEMLRYLLHHLAEAPPSASQPPQGKDVCE
jgi:hypothetical protein